MEMKAPSNKKEVQQLNLRLAALTRFLPKSAEKALPMFELLKKEASVEWNSKCDDAFEDIKQCWPILRVLSKPRLARVFSFTCRSARKPSPRLSKRGGTRTNSRVFCRENPAMPRSDTES
ncbi:hypothetical protein K1719_039388 [Acacia pycnantha]|nr:hypothetical protein K1719_039388 [Acacia pycnantha]